jgi:hypothetical protein
VEPVYSETPKDHGNVSDCTGFSEYSSLANRNTLGLCIYVGCHRMSVNSGVRLYKFYCMTYIQAKHTICLHYTT